MAHEQNAMIGSGTVPYVAQILPTTARGVTDSAGGVRRGTNVMIANTEDLNSVDAFASSGIGVNTSVTLVWGPSINTLPRQRALEFYNRGPDDVLLARNTAEATYGSGLYLPASGKLNLPLLHNVEVYAKSDGYSDVTFIAY